MTYYAQVVDFEAKGEDGTSTFVPLIGDDAGDGHGSSLARWVQLSGGSVKVPAGGSADMPFTVIVPENAEPGGHYAAILVGTQPGNATTTGAQVKVSSFVSSLLFVRIKGDVIESGRIREFVTENSLYEAPEVDFSLRFENTGTTHLKPVGEIVIYNMWGKERGRVALNQESGNFGNVLPSSVRRFDFTWKGEAELFDIGPYSAIVTVSYGEEAKHSASAKTYFWVVPVVPVVLSLLGILAFIALVTWLIRRYIRRALELERLRSGVPALVPEIASSASAMPAPAPAQSATLAALLEPIREGVIDLRSAARGVPAPVPQGSMAAAVPEQHRVSWLELAVKYRLFLLFLVAVVVGGYALSRYLDRALVSERQFQITDVTINEEPVPQMNKAGERK